MYHWRDLFGLRGKNGFSLTEMSVVLASVAAVTVVTVGGSSLIQRSRLGGIVTDVKTFTEAVIAFEDKYKGIPGDTATVATLSGATAGNGNGSIDSASESLQFWKHLTLAGLLQGKYDGTSTYSPGTGVPEGAIKGSGYNALNPTTVTPALPSQSIVIEFSGFTAASNAQPILTPEDAKAIDERLDDGKPNTGVVRGTDTAGNNSTTNCATSNAISATYNINSRTLGCRLRFIIRKSAQASENVTITGSSCNQAGLTRPSEDPNDVCPTGTIGKIFKACSITSSNAGSWIKSESHCQPVTCYGQRKYGEKQVLPCMGGQTGTGILQTCSAEGVWTTDSVNCSFATDPAACVTGTDLKAPQACNWSQTGRITQTCTSSAWSNNSNCALITCSSPPAAANVGVVSVVSGAGVCGTYYTGTYNTTCLMDGNWQATSNACAPAIYAASCTPAVTADFDIGCPPGETGANTQTCIDTNKWVPKSNTCAPITCSGERVGSARIIKDATCPFNRTGVVIEVCKSDGGTPPKGIWIANFTHCATAMCDATKDQAGYATWAYTGVGGTSNGVCLSGYTSSGAPNRQCDSDSTTTVPNSTPDINGKWSTTITTACILQQCPTSHANVPNATWPATPAFTRNVYATKCTWPNYEGLPRADCTAAAGGVSTVGTWVAVGAACKAVSFPALSNIKLWLDAADFSTIFTNTNCTGGFPVAVTNVGCWLDKSGNANNATAGTSPTYVQNIRNGRPVVRFASASSQFLNVPLTFLAGSPYTIFAIDIRGSNVAATYFLGTGAGSNNTSLHYGYLSDTSFILGQYNNNMNTQAIPGWVASTPSFSIGKLDTSVGHSLFYYINGTQYTPSTNPNTNKTALISAASGVIGRGYNATGYYTGDIGEIIIYNSALSSANIITMKTYFSSKWGITIP